MSQRRAILLACAALVAGCASSPPAHFYTLSASAPPAASVASASASSLSIAVGPVTVPALVDRPQIVVSAGPNAVRLDEQNRWASPLQENIARVVADHLAARLGTPRVSLYQQIQSAEADYRVLIDVQAFASSPGQTAVLDAAWSVRRMRDDKALSGRGKWTQALPDKGYDTLAAAHSRALERLSQDIGEALLNLENPIP
jgi:uncharacterized lipoprotein YmbA